MSYREIGDLYGVDLGTVRNRLIKLPEFTPRKPWTHVRRHQIDEHYFDEINTPTKAYLFGLLMADGSNIEGSCVSLDLTDRELVVLFRDELCRARTLKLLERVRPGHKKIFACRIKCASLSRTLARHGMVQSKTHKLKYPSAVSDELACHFVRGYFDGDGCITGAPASKTSAYLRWSFRLVGTRPFLTSVQEILAAQVKVRSSVRPTRSVFCLAVSGNQQVVKVRDWIYGSGGPSLQRKREKFSQVLAGR